MYILNASRPCITEINFKICIGAEMAQLVEGLLQENEDLSLVPRTNANAGCSGPGL